MSPRDTFRSAFWAVTSRPSRTSALVLALGAGVAAAVFVSSIIAGFGREIDRLAFGAYGKAVIVRENVFVTDRHGPPNLADRDRLLDDLEGIAEIAVWKWGRAESWDGRRTAQFDVFGVSGAYHHELDAPVAEGRTLNEAELNSAARVCLIGTDLAEDFGWGELLGRDLRVNGIACRIVGVLGEPASRPAARFAGAVITPLQAANRYFLDDSRRTSNEVDWLTVFMAEAADMDEARMRTDLLLRKRRGAPLSQPSPFQLDDPAAPLAQMTEQRDLLARLLLTLASITLLTSLVAFGSIASASISARRREIALRMTMGATEGDIVSQILAETMLTGLAGSSAGLVAGLGLGLLASTLWGWPFAPDVPISATALLLGLVTGLGLGAVMAAKAARLPPSLAARA